MTECATGQTNYELLPDHSHHDGETDQRLMELSAQAARELDPKKLYALIDEINRVLKEKQDRLKRHTPATD